MPEAGQWCAKWAPTLVLHRWQYFNHKKNPTCLYFTWRSRVFPRDAHHLFARGACDLAHFGLFCAPPPCSVVSNKRKLCYSFFLGGGVDAGMLADAPPLGHYYLCIHLCSHWNNSRAPAASFPPPWGAASEPLLSFSYSIGRPSSERPEQQQQGQQPPFRKGGFKAKPTSMRDHCLYYPCRLTHLWGAAVCVKRGQTL